MRTPQELAHAYVEARTSRMKAEGVSVDLVAVEAVLEAQALDVLSFALPLVVTDFIEDIDSKMAERSRG